MNDNTAIAKTPIAKTSMAKTSIAKTWGLPILLGVVALYLTRVLNPAEIVVLNNVAILALFAAATNLLLGTAGILSFGQACFYGVGAYSIAIAWKFGFGGFWGAALVGPILSAFAAFLVGALALRSRRWFFALLTLSFSQLFFTIAQKLTFLTGGDTGIFGAMVPKSLAEPHGGSLFIVVVTAVSLLLLRVIDCSPHGLILRALRENERRVMGLGVNVYTTQLTAFVLSGLFCGIAGVLSVINQQAAYPSMMDWNASGQPVMAAVIGGMYAFLGPVLGALIYQFGHDVIVSLTTRWQLALGLVILAVILLFPNGVSGLFSSEFWRGLRTSTAGKQEVDHG
jgi:branched-chain amino acid transport system permease protein